LTFWLQNCCQTEISHVFPIKSDKLAYFGLRVHLHWRRRRSDYIQTAFRSHAVCDVKVCSHTFDPLLDWVDLKDFPNSCLVTCWMYSEYGDTNKRHRYGQIACFPIGKYNLSHLLTYSLIKSMMRLWSNCRLMTVFTIPSNRHYLIILLTTISLSII